MLKGYAFVLLAALLWGMIGPASKVAFDQGMSPADTAFWRAGLAWFFFAFHAFKIRCVTVEPRRLPVLLLFAVLCPAGLYGAYMQAVEFGGVALASVLLYTAPAWVCALSVLLLKEGMTSAKLTAVLLTILGVVLVGQGPRIMGDNVAVITPAAVFWGLLSGFFYALFSIFGKGPLRGLPTPTIFLYALPVAVMVFAPFCTFEGITPLSMAACVFLAAFTTYGAFSAYYAGLKRLEATRAAVTATLEPVVASLFGFLVFQERFSVPGYVGSLLIFLAVVVTVVESARRRREFLAR